MIRKTGLIDTTRHQLGSVDVMLDMPLSKNNYMDISKTGCTDIGRSAHRVARRGRRRSCTGGDDRRRDTARSAADPDAKIATT